MPFAHTQRGYLLNRRSLTVFSVLIRPLAEQELL
jgi:hypothetical protein